MHILHICIFIHIQGLPSRGRNPLQINHYVKNMLQFYKLRKKFKCGHVPVLYKTSIQAHYLHRLYLHSAAIYSLMRNTCSLRNDTIPPITLQDKTWPITYTSKRFILFTFT